MEGECLCLRATKSIISIRKSQTQISQLMGESTYSYLSTSFFKKKNIYYINIDLKYSKEEKKKKEFKGEPTPQLGKCHFKLALLIIRVGEIFVLL